jgi:hypothetical protein
VYKSNERIVWRNPSSPAEFRRASSQWCKPSRKKVWGERGIAIILNVRRFQESVAGGEELLMRYARSLAKTEDE